jgi:hypothetical protein
MVDSGRITTEAMQRYLASFALSDLRRFAAFDSSATRPYTISVRV